MAFKDCSSACRPTFYQIDKMEKGIKVIYGRCKSWGCPECSEYLTYLWALRIRFGIRQYQSDGLSGWQMVTITSHEKLRTMGACLDVWGSVWGKLSTRLRRKTPGLKYALIPEMHKNGRVHFHALMNTSANTRWMKDNSRECGGGFEADVGSLESTDSAVYYVTKYIGKDAHKAVWPRGFRRIRTSAKWPHLSDGEDAVYNDLKWLKWRENGEQGYFALLSALARLYSGFDIINPDLRASK